MPDAGTNRSNFQPLNVVVGAVFERLKLVYFCLCAKKTSFSGPFQPEIVAEERSVFQLAVEYDASTGFFGGGIGYPG